MQEESPLCTISPGLGSALEAAASPVTRGVVSGTEVRLRQLRSPRTRLPRRSGRSQRFSAEPTARDARLGAAVASGTARGVALPLVKRG